MNSRHVSGSETEVFRVTRSYDVQEALDQLENHSTGTGIN